MKVCICLPCVAAGLLIISAGGGSTPYTIRFSDEAISFPELDEGRGVSFTATLDDATFRNESIRAQLSQFGVLSFVPIAPGFRHLAERNLDRWGNEIKLVDMTDDYVVTFERELNDEQLRSLLATESVSYVTIRRDGEFFFTPNDTYFGEQWALENTGQTLGFGLCYADSTATTDYDSDATSAWNDVLVPGCKIGVLDSGIRISHNDLSDSFDSDLTDLVSGDACGHGTAVCGVIAAAGDNGMGIAGIACPDVDESSEMLVVRSVEGGYCAPALSLANSALALLANDEDYAEVGVVNESYGEWADKGEFDPTDRDARRNAYVKGLFLVAASGNVTGCAFSSQDSCFAYPAAFNNFVTAVSGLNHDGVNQWPAFSYTDLVAGSDNIVTTWNASDSSYRGHGTNSVCGTSLAAPYVTGAAAMLLGANSSLTNDDLKAVLLHTAEDLGSTGRDDVYGHGQLKLADAIAYVSSPNHVYHGTTTSFSATYLGSPREQEFANTPFNADPDTFEPFWVRPYELEITASFAAKGINETVIDAWGRPRVSQGFPNDERIDALLLTSYLEPDLGSMTSSSIKLYTYTYKVFDSDSTTCLGWYPIEVPGEGSCGSSANLAKFDYTFVTEPSSMAQGPVVGSPTLSVMAIARPGVVEVRAMKSSIPIPAEFELLDVGGRIVTRIAESDSRGATLQTGDVPSGVYFVRARSGEETASQKITIVR
ncbi:MAG: S8 family peptidase [Candidatus Eisenbacteria bacterium]